jgi:hypothetical protein
VAGLSGVERLVASSAYACAFSASGQAWCFLGVDRPGRPRAPVRVGALDGASTVVLPELGVLGSVAAIGATGALRIGKTPGFDSLAGLVLTDVPGMARIRRIAGSGRELFVEDHVGNVFALLVIDGRLSDARARTPVAGVRSPVDLNAQGLALLPGGEVLAIERAKATSARLIEHSELIGLIDGTVPCGLSTRHDLVCIRNGSTLSWMTNIEQIAGHASRHQCAVDRDGAVWCRGACAAGQCGVRSGLERSDTPIELALP